MRVITLDIETIAPPMSSAALTKFKDTWKPPANYKDPEKIESKYMEAEASWLKKGALDIGRAIPIAIGMYDSDLDKTEVWVGDDPKEGMEFFVNIVDGGQYPDVLTGFNIEHFDLPIMERWLSKTGVKLSQKFEKWGVIDLMRYCGKGGFKKIVADLDIDEYGMDGSAVAALYEAKDWETIKAYAGQDALNCWKLWEAKNSIRRLK